LYLPLTGLLAVFLASRLEMTDPLHAAIFVAALPVPGFIVMFLRFIRGEAGRVGESELGA
jgi:hypothetical protein